LISVATAVIPVTIPEVDEDSMRESSEVVGRTTPM